MLIFSSVTLLRRHRLVAGIGCTSGQYDRVRRHLDERRHGAVVHRSRRNSRVAIAAPEPARGRGAERRRAAGHEVGLLLVEPAHRVEGAVAELELAGTVQGTDGILGRDSPS